MAEGRQAHDWTIASHLMWLIAECHRDPKRSGRTEPWMFNPMDPRCRAKARTREADDRQWMKRMLSKGSGDAQATADK